MFPFDVQELRENLKHSNFSDLEVDLFFDKFKEDPEMNKMLIGNPRLNI